jgi:hypothetical protein
VPVVARARLVAALGQVLLPLALGACGAHHAARAHARPRRSAHRAGHTAPHSEVDDLVARGYHAVTLQQVWDAWHHGSWLPAKPIAFSFDDGYSSQETNGMPELPRIRVDAGEGHAGVERSLAEAAHAG